MVMPRSVTSCFGRLHGRPAGSRFVERCILIGEPLPGELLRSSQGRAQDAKEVAKRRLSLKLLA
jgi:hypothetical protein